MAKQPCKRLTARRVDTESRPGRYADGDGLYLEVEPSGSKRWTLRVMAGGRRRDIGLGGVRNVSLAVAREEAAKARRAIRAGLDPIAARRKARAAIPSFKAAALAMHKEHGPTWNNEKHAAQWLATLEQHAFPILGEHLVSQVDGPAIREALLPIWLAIPETARRVRQRIGAVLDWASSKGYRTGENPIRAVTKGMPKQPSQKGHFRALEYSKVAPFMAALKSSNSSEPARLAFEWLILTAGRTSEVIYSRWSEIDQTAGTWTIPAERMKAKKAHVVPLAPRCIEILKRAKELHSGTGDFIFESRPNRPFSNMVFLKTIESMGEGGNTTAHGLRSSFRDWAAETTSFPNDVIEMALAHSIKNKTEAAYRRGDLLEKRRNLMAAWERHCLHQIGKVVKLRR